jgi:hypothetical protein
LSGALHQVIFAQLVIRLLTRFLLHRSYD